MNTSQGTFLFCFLFLILFHRSHAEASQNDNPAPLINRQSQQTSSPDISTNSSDSLGKNVTAAPTREKGFSLLKNVNSSNGGLIAELLGEEYASFITTGMAFLGAALGHDGCDLKAACLIGTMFPTIQGRDIAMVAVEPLIPNHWRAVYQAIRSSMIKGQDCSQFSCF